MLGWDLVEEKLLTEDASSYTFANLNGDTAEEYRLVARIVNKYNGTATYALQFNSDTGSNYGYQQLYAYGGTNKGSGRGTGAGFRLRTNGYAVNAVGLSDTIIHAKSGFIRTAISKCIDNVANTTVDAIVMFGQSWNNTADNITSIKVLEESGNAAGLGVGTHLFLFKKRTTAGGCWKLLYNTTLTGAATAISIPNLDGDKHKLYELRTRVVAGANSGFNLTINTDNTHYGQQFLSAENTTVGAYSQTTPSSLYNNSLANGQVSISETLIYAKSGFPRTLIHEDIYYINGTTVTGIEFAGQAWNDSANNITSLELTAGSNALAAGTVVELWGFSVSEAYTKEFSDDAFEITDARSRAIRRPVSETMTISEAIGKAGTRTVLDVMTITDAINRGFGKTMAEIMAISDTIVRRITRLWADTITITEVGAKAVSLFIDDTITATDTIVRSTVRILTDSIDLSDTLAWAFKWLRITYIATAWTKTTNAVSTWAKSVKGASIWQKLNR